MSKLISCLVLIAFFSCNSESVLEKVLEVELSHTSATSEMKKSHFRMLEELQKLYDEGTGDKYFNWSNAKADSIKLKIEAVSGLEKVKLIMDYCTQIINAGAPEKAIIDLNNIGSSLGMSYENMNADNKKYYDLLALAYLRYGEQVNCQQNHNEFSCIAPIIKTGVHTDQEGSIKAIEIYTELVKHFPEDLQSRWLLNLAYMTLGKYPQDVPKEYFIDIEDENCDLTISRFREVGMNTGSATNKLAGGVSIEDFNGDGLLDIFASSFWMNDDAQLLINDGLGGFVDVSDKSGLTGLKGGLNSVHIDYDNDGDKDIYILRGGWLRESGNHPNSLLNNDGKGNFIDVTFMSGLGSYAPTQTASWADYDNDGDLDLFVGNESLPMNKKPCELYENLGNGTFKNIAKEKGIDFVGFVKAVVWGDIDNDGWEDLLISNATGENILYRNSKGNFEDISKEAGIGMPLQSFPSWFWDYNNDGLLDIFICSYDFLRQAEASHDYAAEKLGLPPKESRSILYKNVGNNKFIDVTKEVNLEKTFYAMGVNFVDLDNNGFLDFYIGTGAPDLRSSHPNRMLLNDGGKKFCEVTSQSGTGHIQKGHGVAFGDLDNDGDNDLYSVIGGALEGDFYPNVLFENQGNNNNWIGIELVGKTINRDCIGSKIIITTEKGKFYNTVNTGGSFGSNSLRKVIGLGTSKTIEQIEVIYAGSTESNIIKGLKLNSYFRIIQGDNTAEQIDYPKIKLGNNESAQQHHH